MRKKSGASWDIHLKIDIKSKAKENVYIIERKKKFYIFHISRMIEKLDESY